MREILFRGKRKDNGEWVEGFLTIDPTICDYVIDMVGLTSIMIHPETVGQYTGLCDKNGKKIFEGDIVKNGEDIMVILWYNFEASFVLSFSIDSCFIETISNSHIYLEIIGNIHDNPELLKGGAE